MTDEPSSPDPFDGGRPDPFDGAPWDGAADGEPAPRASRRSSSRSSARPSADDVAVDGSEGSRGERVRVRRRIPRDFARILRRRRRLGLAMIVVGGVIVLTGLWIAVTALIAKHDLEQVRAEVTHLRTEIRDGDFTAARATAQQIADNASSAHDWTTGPAWATVAALPGGQPLRTVRAIAVQADVLGSGVLPKLVSASSTIDPATLRRPDGSIDVAALGRVVPVLTSADSALARATAAVADQPAHTWVGAVDRARTSLLGQLASLNRTVHIADTAAKIAPELLGANGTRRYFVAFQNDAEARGTGGIPGAFAIIRATNGKVTFERFEADTTLDGVSVDPPLGADYYRQFGGLGTTSQYVNSNLGPNFPYAAQIWIAMWRKHSGERLDGALAVDPTALSYLLRVTGPAKLPDGTSVTYKNVVALTQSTVYAKFAKPAQNAQRKDYLLALAKALSKHIIDSGASTTKLVRAGAHAVGQRRLLLYSTDPAVEAALAPSAIAGQIPRTTRPFVGLSIYNVGGNKLDYYLNREITWTRTGCGATRTVTVRITLTNTAPASGLSSYVTNRADHAPYRTRPGDNRLGVSYYASDGAEVLGHTLDGKDAPYSASSSFGHPVMVFDVEMPRGMTRTIVLTLREPAGTGTPDVLTQPLVRPIKTTVTDSHC